MPLKTFAEVQQLIDQVLTQNGEIGGVSAAPHGSFWTALSYQEFTTGDVRRQPRGLRSWSSAISRTPTSFRLCKYRPIVRSEWRIGQMPGNGPPFFTDDQIKEIADWIDLGCPQ